MEVTLHIPDDVAQRLSASGSDLSRRALEAFSLEEYKAGRLTEAQVAPAPRPADTPGTRRLSQGSRGVAQLHPGRPRA